MNNEKSFEAKERRLPRSIATSQQSTLSGETYGATPTKRHAGQQTGGSAQRRKADAPSQR